MSLNYFKNFLIFIITLIILGLLLKYSRPYFKSENRLVIESTFSLCASNIELYINSLQDAPQTNTIICEKQSNYNFLVENNIEFLRIDLGNLKNNVVIISKIDIYNKNNLIKTIHPIDLKEWKANDINVVAFNKDNITLKTTGQDPFIYSHTNVFFESLGYHYFKNLINGYLNNYYILSIISIIFFSASILLYLKNKFLDPLLIFSTILITYFSLYVFKDISLPMDVSSAVGRATYFGSNSINIYFSILFSIFISFIYILILKGKDFSITLSEEDQKAISKKEIASTVLFILFLFSYYIYDLSEISISNLNVIYEPNWDGNNILYWEYLTKNGYLPFLDFWYPYSGNFLFSLNSGYGELIGFLYKIILYLNLFLALYLYDRKHTLLNILITLAIIIGIEKNIFWGGDRYLLSILFSLAIALYLYNNKTYLLQYFLISSILLVCIFDTPQILYSISGVILLIILELITTRGKPSKGHIKKWFSLILIIFITITPIIIILYKYNLLLGFVEFSLSLSSMANYSAIPRNSNDLLKSFFSFQFLILIIPPALLAISLYRFIYINKKNSVVILLISIVSLFLLGKHLVRSIDNQILITFFIWLIFYLKSFRIGYVNKYYYQILIVFLVLFVASIDIRYIFTRVLNSVSRLSSTANFIFEKGQIEYKFQQNSLEKFVEEKKLLKFINNKYGSIPEFYVFGDNLSLYMLSNKKPFFHTNVYNQSPLNDQIRTISDISNRQVSLIIIDRNQLNFDLVPNVIRLPKLTDFILQNYYFEFNFNNFSVLRLRNKHDAPNINSFLKIFGDSIDLKFIPLQTNIVQLTSSYIEGEEYIKIKINKDYIYNNKRINIVFNIDSEEFKLEFDINSYKDEYYIKLSNIWFLQYAISNKLKINIPEYNHEISFIKINNKNVSLY